MDAAEKTQNKHLETLSVWYHESEKLALARMTHFDLTPDDIQRESALFREQMVDLFEHLVDEQVLDIRQGWMGNTVEV